MPIRNKNKNESRYIVKNNSRQKREESSHNEKKIAQKAITVNIFQKQKQSKDLGHVKI